MSKTVIISGASGNLGQATVSFFLQKMYNVIATVSSGSALGALNEHNNLKVFELDVTNEIACKKFVEKIATDFLKIDCALFLVGGYQAGNIHNTSISDIQKQIQLNFTTAYNLAQPVFENMLLQPSGGKIIFIGSKPGINALDAKGSLAYGLSKSLLFRLADIINLEGKGKNITASVIVPATMDTPANRKAMPAADFNAWVKPDDVAAAMEYICSDHGNSLRETVLKIYGNA